MNPDAKEFVPAHLRKKNDDPDSNSDKQQSSTEQATALSTTTNTTTATATSTTTTSSSSNTTTTLSADAKAETADSSLPHSPDSTAPDDQTKGDTLEKAPQSTSSSNNAKHRQFEYNGNKYIVPDTEDGTHRSAATRCGYDFGNATDNQDEDVCNAFEEFLETLPDEK